MRTREKLRRILTSHTYNTARSYATKYGLSADPRVRSHIARLYRTQQSEVHRVTDLEREAMIATCPKTMTGYRNAALLSQPFRARDLHSLTVTDVYMTREMKRWIAASGIEHGFILRSVRANAIADERMSVQSIAKVIRDAAESAGISGHITGSSLEREPYTPKSRPASTYLRKD